MKPAEDTPIPDREFLAANGSTLVRNGGCYEEYTYQGQRYACGWNGIKHDWITRRLKPLR